MPQVTFENENRTFTVLSNSSLMEACEEQGTSLLFGCASAACGTCRIRVLSNAGHLSPMSDEEIEFLASIDAAPDERLACQCRVLGDFTFALGG